MHAFLFPKSKLSAQYDPEAGKIYLVPFRKDTPVSKKIGGYGQLLIKDGPLWEEAARLAYLAVNGVLPSGPVEYKNGDGTDIRWKNLKFSQ